MTILAFLFCALTAQELIPLEFEDVELKLLLELVSKHTKKRFVYTKEVQSARVFVKSPNPVKRENLYRVFESIMEFNGFALIPLRENDDAEIVKVIPRAKLQTQSPNLIELEQLPSLKEDDKFITLIYPLQHINASEVQQAISNIAKQASIVAMEESNTLLISDFLPAVKQIVRMIRLMDIQPKPTVIVTVFLKHKTVEEIIPKLEELLSEDSERSKGTSTRRPSGSGGTSGVQISALANRGVIKLIPDETNNSIIIKALPEKIKMIQELIASLDHRQTLPDQGIRIYDLKHANAEELQKVISDLISKGNFAQPEQAIEGQPVRKAGQQRNSGNEPTIVAYRQTNALLFTGSKIQLDQVENLIQKLDIRHPQVLIEAAFVEITPTNVFNLGVELALLDQPAENSTRGVGGTSFGLSTLVDETGTPITGSSTGIPVGRLPLPGEGINFALTRGNAFKLPLILQMLEQTSETKVLSTPRVLTNDNHQAEIKVSDAVPVVQFQTTDAGTDSTSFQEFEEAGTELKITPHIAEDKYLRLDIEQVIESFDFTVSAIASAPPPKTTRSLKTSITIPDGHTIVIGGLVGNSYQKRVEKIPVLGDIPLLGYLFRNTVRTQTKTNVYLFLTAHILREPNFKDLNRLTFRDKNRLSQEELEDLDEFLDRYKEKNMTIDPEEGDHLYLLEYNAPNLNKKDE